MLVIEKSKDIVILKTMGATNQLIRRIFLLEGMLTSLTGAVIGIVTAVIVCLIQIYFEVIKLQGSGTFVIEAYPVEMQPMDFILVALTVILISIGTSWVPATRAASRAISVSQE
jgi:lipoprotein-releasing system permease protein